MAEVRSGRDHIRQFRAPSVVLRVARRTKRSRCQWVDNAGIRTIEAGSRGILAKARWPSTRFEASCSRTPSGMQFRTPGPGRRRSNFRHRSRRARTSILWSVTTRLLRSCLFSAVASENVSLPFRSLRYDSKPELPNAFFIALADRACPWQRLLDKQ